MGLVRDYLLLPFKALADLADCLVSFTISVICCPCRTACGWPRKPAINAQSEIV